MSMFQSLRKMLVVVILLSSICLAAPVVTAQSYADDFEQATISPAWVLTTQNGSIALSTEQAHSGSQSIKLSSTTGGQREIHLTQNFANPLQGTASIWFYDTAPGQQTLYSRFILSAAGNFVAGVYIQDYDGGSYYAAGGGVGGGPTTAARSLGWHLFEIDTAGGKIRIDGVEVLAFPGGASFDSVDLNVTGPGGPPDTAYYFDDFAIVPAIGQSVFFDDFNGDTLDLSRWTVLDGAGGMQVTGGLLAMQGAPDHKDLNSIATFAPTGTSSILAHARIRLGGDYQKFGFNVNYIGQTNGFYFDTLDASIGGDRAIASYIITNWGILHRSSIFRSYVR